MPSKQSFGGPPIAGGYGYGQGPGMGPNSPGMGGMGMGAMMPPMAGQGRRAQMQGGAQAGDPFGGIFGQMPTGGSPNNPSTSQISNEQLLGLARQDWMDTNTAVQENYQRGLNEEAGMRDLIQGIGERGDAFAEDLISQGDAGAQRMEESGQENLEDFKRYMSGSLSTTRGFLEDAIAKADETAASYDAENQAAFASQAMATDAAIQQQMTQLNSNPNLTPAQRARAQQSLRFSGMVSKQQQIAPLQHQARQNLASLRMQSADMRGRAGQVYGSTSAAFGSQLNTAQGQQLQSQQMAEGLRQNSRIQARTAQLQGEQLMLSGQESLARMVQSNPMRTVSQLPVGMLANALQTIQPGNSGVQVDPFAGGGTTPFGKHMPSTAVRNKKSEMDHWRFVSMKDQGALMQRFNQGPSGGYINPFTGQPTRAQSMFDRNMRDLNTRYS